MSVRYYIGLLPILITGCTPWGHSEVSELLNKQTATIGSYRVQLNLHEIKGKEMNEVWLWCQTDKTADLKLSEQLNQNAKAAAFTQVGWKLFLSTPTMNTNIPVNFAESIFHPVNDSIAFGGHWNTYITFDTCVTTSVVSPDINFTTLLSDKRPGLDPKAGRFFKKFTPTADNVSGCFEIDSLYFKDQTVARQLCTTDKGKTWAEPPYTAAPAEKPPEGTKS